MLLQGRILRLTVGLMFALSMTRTNARAAANSWVFGGNDFWDTTTRWSLGKSPSVSDSADFVTNAATKTVTIDDTDTAFFSQELTISNLTVAGATGSSTTNTLSLTNMDRGALIPLRILNGLTIGTRGVLQMTNSMLEVDGLSDGTFQLNGFLRLNGDVQFQAQNGTFGSGATLQLSLNSEGDNIVISNLTLASNSALSLSDGIVGNVYTVLTTVAVSGAFGQVTPGYIVNYSSSAITVQLIPEPSVIFLSACGLSLIGVVIVRRRPR